MTEVITKRRLFKAKERVIGKSDIHFYFADEPDHIIAHALRNPDDSWYTIIPNIAVEGNKEYQAGSRLHCYAVVRAMLRENGYPEAEFLPNLVNTEIKLST
jgi:hypothetical protein